MLKSKKDYTQYPKHRPKAALTEREKEVLQIICTGSGNAQISEKLRISQNTVKTHIRKIYKKINANNRFQACLWSSKNLK